MQSPSPGSADVRTWRHRTVAAVACSLAVAAVVAWAGSQNGQVANAGRQNALAASLGEKWVNECDLFGCHTVLAPPPPHSRPYHGQRLAQQHVPPHAVERRVTKNVDTRLDAANAKLAVLAASLVSENETAMEAYNTTLSLESAMHTIEKQSHLDRVQLRTEHAERTTDETLLRQSRQHEHAAMATADAERGRLVQVEKVARVEGVELAAARKRLHLSTELQAKAWAEAHKYRDALEKATQKLVNYKTSTGKQELKLEKEVKEDAEDAQKQMMEEQDAESSTEMSDKEVIERLTEEVRRLTVELKQRESVIQLQQKVIKVQAHEVKQLETSAEKNVDSAAETMSSIMNSAEAAMAGETVKHEADEERENAEIEAKHPGIDPASIPTAFSKPPVKGLPEPTSWRSFGKDAVANNANNTVVPVVGHTGVVADKDFAAGVKGARGTKTKEETAKKKAAVEEADHALQAFDHEETAQKAEVSEFFSKGSSPAAQAHAEAEKNEQDFERMISARPVPDPSSIDDYLSTARLEREKVRVELEHQRQKQVAADAHRARKSERADKLVRGMLRYTGSGLEKNFTAAAQSSTVGKVGSGVDERLDTLKRLNTLKALNPASALAPTNILDPQRESKSLKNQLEGASGGGHGSNHDVGAVAKREGGMPPQLPTMSPLKTGSQLGGIEGVLNAQVAGRQAPAPATMSLNLKTLTAMTTGELASSANSAAIAAKAAGIASFIVAGHTPVSGHVKPHLQREQAELAPAPPSISLAPSNAVLPHAAAISLTPHNKVVPQDPHAISLEPRNAVLPPLVLSVTHPAKTLDKSTDASAVKAAAAAGAAHVRQQATEPMAAGTRHAAVVAGKERHADTLADDLARAAQQLDSYNFLHEQKLTLPSTDTGEVSEASAVAPIDKSVAQQMQALENGEKATRRAHHNTWLASGLGVKSEGNGSAKMQNLALLPADMRGGMHIAARYEAASATHTASFRDNNRGTPQHESALRWRIAETQNKVKAALVKEVEGAKARVDAAKKAEVAEHTAALLAEKEVSRLDAIEAGAAVRTALETAHVLRAHASQHTPHGTAAHIHQASAAHAARSSGATSPRPGKTISAALARAARAVKSAESALGDETTAHTAAEMAGDIGGSEAGVKRMYWAKSGVGTPQRPSRASMAWSYEPKTSAQGMLGASVVTGQSALMRKEEGNLHEEVGGPIKRTLAKEIVESLSKLTDMTRKMNFHGNLFTQRDASIDGEAAVQDQHDGEAAVQDQHDASMDAKAAVLDLVQLDKSEETLMNPPPLQFQVKVPPGGVPGRRMEVHLPDSRTEMVLIPPHVKPGQMLEVDAPRPFNL